MEKHKDIPGTAKSRRAVVIGTGSSVPDQILTNFDLEKIVDTSDEWITTRTGIKERRIASDDQTTASLGLEAARQAINKAGIKGENIDLIICTTITPEMVFPSTACIIQNGLNCIGSCAFDLAAACSGYTYGIAIASSFIERGQCNTALVVGSETLSRITNYEDRTSCILFGDGAGAVLLQARESSERGVLYTSLHADGHNWEVLSCRAYGSRYPVGKPLDDPSYMYMELRGRETYQLAVRRIVEMIEEAYDHFGISNDDITLIIPHQMNARIIESVVKRLKLPENKMYVNIEKYGNTSAASIAIALDEAVSEGKINEGDLIVLVAFGGGLTWAVNLIKW
ncbi:MAG: ketoacyl-ACP synthase III [Sedimentisphaerales bacterium]|nr:ketoacyl-ACP synthase III [Sedimentisphaerales bacterium]